MCLFSLKTDLGLKCFFAINKILLQLLDLLVLFLELPSVLVLLFLGFLNFLESFLKRWVLLFLGFLFELLND